MKCCAAGVMVLVAAGFAWGQKPPEQKPIQLILHPQKEPVPALKYALLPDVTELHPGNAAIYYHRAMLIRCERRPTQAEAQQISDWIQMPLKDMPRPAVHKALQRYGSVLHELDLGVRCADMDWGLLFRTEGIDLLLPEVQAMRSLVQLVALQARLEMAEGHFETAAHSIQTGFTMSRHVTQAARTLVETLVGIALAGVMDQRVAEFIQLKGAPNLYWSLTALPRPFINLRPGLEGDKLWLWRTMPELHRLEQETLTVAEVNRLVTYGFNKSGLLGSTSNEPNMIRLELTALTVKAYPRAKAWLRGQGKTEAQIEAMPALQAVVRYSLFHFHRLQDELYKWAYLPYWKAEPGLEKAMRELKQAKATLSEGIPLASLLLPAIERVVQAPAHFQQRLAALRIVEAIRLYAAEHEGELPASLDDLQAVPIPNDPMTGKLFHYERTGDTALLAAPASVSGAPRRAPLKYQLRIAR